MNQKERINFIRSLLSEYSRWEHDFYFSAEKIKRIIKNTTRTAKEKEFLEDVLSDIDHVVQSYLTTDKTDATDLWRENLKAWTLKQQCCFSSLSEAIAAADLINLSGYEVGSVDHAMDMVKEGQEAIKKAHYQGEF